MADWITGQDVHERIYGPLVEDPPSSGTFVRQGGLSQSVKDRFAAEQARTGVTVPDTVVVLRTAQLELVSRAL